MDLCFLDNGITDAKKKAVKIKIAVGNEGLRRINASSLSDTQQEDPAKLYKLFEDQLKISVNFRIHRLEFLRLRQHKGETLDDFVNRCRTKAKDCDFGQDELHERVIEQVIASTDNEMFQRELLDKDKGCKIEEMLETGRKYEAFAAGKQSLEQLSHGHTSAIDSMRSAKKTCKNCGLSHAFRRCPAYNDTCNFCNYKGHWEEMCMKKAAAERHSKAPAEGHSKLRSKSRRGRSRGRFRSTSPSRDRNSDRRTSPSRDRNSDRRGTQWRNRNNVHSIDTDESADEDEGITFSHITSTGGRDEAYASLDIKLPNRAAKLRVKVDSGAQRNTLPVRIFRDMYPDRLDTDGYPIAERNGIRLFAYNDTEIPQYGTVTIPCRFQKSKWIDTTFYVVDVKGPAIAGLPSCEQLDIISLHCAIQHIRVPETTLIESKEGLREQYPDRFEGLGSFPGEAKLHVDPNVQPRIDPPRKTPIALREPIKAELTKMLELGVIRKVEEPTEWVSSLAYSRKKDGSLRVCLDPKHLNQALKRPVYKITTLEEINHRFNGAKYFSKLDAKSGYWSIKLHPDSQLLTTFQTPFGRYCFTRLPFGLSVSQDIFQAKIDEILDGLQGVVGIADDIGIAGKTEEEHNKNLIALMERARKHGLVLNYDKCDIKASSIEFFGQIYSDEGIKPDPSKIEDLTNMKVPENKQELQEFLGLLTYLSPFVPNLAEKASCLRDLLKKDVQFLWEPHHDNTFKTLKKLISNKSTLKYFDVKKMPILMTDASIKGLGAALLQEENGLLKPVAYASKTLSAAEKNYACIERELLAIVFGVQRYHTYLYGRQFRCFTDHKPLVMILGKGLTNAPPRLQRMLLKLQGYSIQIEYKPGKEMTLPDTLSRLPSTKRSETIDLDVRVDFIRFTAEKTSQLREESRKNTTLNSLADVIRDGWPEAIRDLPTDLRPFWSIRDELSVEDGIILKGNRVLIPPPMQEDILQQLHYGHLGIEKTLLRAKDSVYWVGMKRDIEQMSKACQVCQEMLPTQQHEPLLPHEVPNGPWEKVGTDLFELHGTTWLIIADYFSKFPVVRKLPSPSPSSCVIRVTQEVFSEYGIPQEVVSDNGPHFKSEYTKFAHTWGFTHTTSSPRYPRSNGFIESMVKSVKQTLKKAKKSGQNEHLALLSLRATPINNKIPSPGELLRGQKLSTPVPSKIEYHRGDRDEIRENLEKKQTVMKEFRDRNARPLASLTEGQRVRFQMEPHGSWVPAEIMKKADTPRSYVLQTPNGSCYRRNRSHIRDVPHKRVRFTFEDDEERQEPVKPPPEPPDSAPPENTSGEHGTPQPRTPHATPYTTRYGRIVQRNPRYKD